MWVSNKGGINESLPFVDYGWKEMPNTKYNMSLRWCKGFPIFDLHCGDEFPKKRNVFDRENK